MLQILGNINMMNYETILYLKVKKMTGFTDACQYYYIQQNFQLPEKEEIRYLMVKPVVVKL